jgi:hypothetical protein
METVKVTFHEFWIGDVDDPSLYYTMEIDRMMRTVKGQWVTGHAKDVTYQVETYNNHYHGYKVTMKADMDDKTAVYYKLLWD